MSFQRCSLLINKITNKCFARPATIENHKSALSGMKQLKHHNSHKLRNGFERPLVAICRHPLPCVSQPVYMTLAVFRGLLRKDNTSRVDPIIASCDTIGFMLYRTNHFSLYFKMGSRLGSRTYLFLS